MCITDQLAVFSEARLRFALLLSSVFEVRADGGREVPQKESTFGTAWILVQSQPKGEWKGTTNDVNNSIHYQYITISTKTLITHK